jgi:hypothetical protein
MRERYFLLQDDKEKLVDQILSLDEKTKNCAGKIKPSVKRLAASKINSQTKLKNILQRKMLAIGASRRINGAGKPAIQGARVRSRITSITR